MNYKRFFKKILLFYSIIFGWIIFTGLLAYFIGYKPDKIQLNQISSNPSFLKKNYLSFILFSLPFSIIYFIYIFIKNHKS